MGMDTGQGVQWYIGGRHAGVDGVGRAAGPTFLYLALVK